jgi:acetyltransferase
MSEHFLKHFFEPESIAIIGASHDKTKRSGIPLREMLRANCKCDIYPVNPKYSEIEGIRCYPSIKDIDKPIDLALICLPAEATLQAVKECAEKGVKFLVIISAGWAEIGGEGLKRQGELKKIVEESGIRICGPNCLGMINFHKRIPVTYLTPGTYTPGPVGVVFQSGALSASFIFMAEDRNINLSYWVAPGNEVDLTILDFMDYMVEDPLTKIVLAYVEGINDGGRFKLIAEKAIKRKVPIVIYKVGRSKLGEQQVRTHTAHLAGSYEIFKAFCKQYGIIEVDSIEEMLDVAEIVSNYGIPKLENVGVVSFSGGAAVEFLDECSETNLKIPQFDLLTIQKLSSIIPARVPKRNPLDLMGAVDPDIYDKIAQYIAQDENIDVIVFIVGWWRERAKITGEVLSKARKEISKPLIAIWITAESAAEGGIRKLRENGVPVFPNVKRCVQALERVNNYVKFIEMWQLRNKHNM